MTYQKSTMLGNNELTAFKTVVSTAFTYDGILRIDGAKVHE